MTLNKSLFIFTFLLLYQFAAAQETQPASLLPAPQEIAWSNESFDISKLTAIEINDPGLKNMAARVQELFSFNKSISVRKQSGSAGPGVISLQLTKVDVPLLSHEAYQLTVTNDNIDLKANTLHGMFNGIQTLRQLIFAKKVAGCAIRDWPAFTWRGYMVDVGRNYQSIELLKQQIDVMAQYKLNVFHFHATEDIAWRIAIKQYPQLTHDTTMIRNKGKFYSEQEIRELIQYCKERYITFVPEMDMPGHSAAFTRAFGVEMQSKEGLAITKNIVKEFLETYDLPYFHFGADEVRFTNENFIPEIEQLVHNKKVETIGWHPGGNYSDATIRQLWSQGKMDKEGVKYIDSRDLYVNHMDAHESVVSIFQKRICDVNRGDEFMLGAEMCLWNDRRVETENHLLTQNPVYPAMLAFAERVWQGGGFKSAAVDIGDAGSARAVAFEEFESRLIDHKKLYFGKLPFPYVRQANIEWKLFGPFENNGDLHKSFWPQEKMNSLEEAAASKIVTGGTIILRHWWYPLLTSWLEKPKEKTTWYAYRRIWKDRDTTGYMWIGFNTPSTSYATDSPKENTWDNQNSKIWINGVVIAPPKWKNAGMHGKPEIPLADEGYFYRQPTKVTFKKGWNTILIKVPADTFAGKDWQNPVKWIFTAIPVHKGAGINWYADDVNNDKRPQ